MGTIRLQRAEGEYADVPSGTSDEAALRALGFKDIGQPAVDDGGLPPWPLRSTPTEYLEAQAGNDQPSGLVAERIALAERYVEAGMGDARKD